MDVETVIRLPDQDSGLQHCIVRFNNCHIDARRQNHRCFFRREPLIIRNRNDGTKVLRYAMGNSGLSITKQAIGLDYDAVDALNIGYKQAVDLEVRRAKRWEVWQWFWRHPDQGVQLSIKLGCVGAGLGLMGLVSAIAPYLLR